MRSLVTHPAEFRVYNKQWVQVCKSCGGVNFVRRAVLPKGDSDNEPVSTWRPERRSQDGGCVYAMDVEVMKFRKRSEGSGVRVRQG